MLLLAPLAAAAAAAAMQAAPQPSPLRTFQDWTVGCDNGLGCEAVSLAPEHGEWEEWVNLVLRRGAGANDRTELIVNGPERPPAALVIDGRTVPARFADFEGGYRIAGDEAALIAAIRAGRELEVRDAGGARLGRVSLSGASAAMLYMDERQRRLGTVTALVRRGDRPASAVPAPPALPRVRPAPAPTDRALRIETAVVAGLRRRFECGEFDVREDSEFETAQIATGTTLVLVPCGSGAYNFSSVPVIARRRGGRVVTEVAPFDIQWGIAAEGHPILVNAEWDPAGRRLLEFSKARGLGDCGTRAEYAWDGTRFRLVRQEDMEECRGSLYYVTTWRAETVGR